MRRVSLVGFTTLCSFLTLTSLTFVSAQPVKISLRDGAITPSRIEATKGKKIQLVVENDGKSVHNFVVPAFYVFTQNLAPGKSVDVSFTPSKLGKFPYYSDKNGKPEKGMEGTMVVH